MSKLEKDIMKAVRLCLERMESDGCILWQSRLNSGKIETVHGRWVQLCKQGTADFIAILPVKDGVMVYFIETKSDTGRQSAPQLEFQKQVEAWGAIYEIVTDVKQVRTTVETITGFYADKLKNIDY